MSDLVGRHEPDQLAHDVVVEPDAPGIRIDRLDLSASLLGRFKGQRFGRDGLRLLLDDRPTALLVEDLHWARRDDGAFVEVRLEY